MRVREPSELEGSLKAMWPSLPMPRICRSMPPHSTIRCSYHWQKAGVVVGRARGDVDVLLGDVDVLEQVLVHEVVVALRMVLREAHVLVEIEGGHLGEVEALRRGACRTSSLYKPQRRGTGGQAQHGVRLGVEHLGDDPGGHLAHFGRGFFDDHFHEISLS